MAVNNVDYKKINRRERRERRERTEIKKPRGLCQPRQRRVSTGELGGKK